VTQARLGVAYKRVTRDYVLGLGWRQRVTWTRHSGAGISRIRCIMITHTWAGAEFGKAVMTHAAQLLAPILNLLANFGPGHCCDSLLLIAIYRLLPQPSRYILPSGYIVRKVNPKINRKQLPTGSVPTHRPFRVQREIPTQDIHLILHRLACPYHRS